MHTSNLKVISYADLQNHSHHHNHHLNFNHSSNPILIEPQTSTGPILPMTIIENAVSSSHSNSTLNSANQQQHLNGAHLIKTMSLPVTTNISSAPAITTFNLASPVLLPAHTNSNSTSSTPSSNSTNSSSQTLFCNNISKNVAGTTNGNTIVKLTPTQINFNSMGGATTAATLKKASSVYISATPAPGVQTSHHHHGNTHLNTNGHKANTFFNYNSATATATSMSSHMSPVAPPLKHFVLPKSNQKLIILPTNISNHVASSASSSGTAPAFSK